MLSRKVAALGLSVLMSMRAAQRPGIIIITMRCTAVIGTDTATVTEPVYRQATRHRQNRHLQRHAIIKDIMAAIDA